MNAAQIILLATGVVAGVLTLALVAALIFIPTMRDTGAHVAAPDAQRPDAGSRRYHHMTEEERRAWRYYHQHHREGPQRVLAA